MTDVKLPAAPDLPSFAPRLYGIALLVAAIVLTGVALIGRFTALDLARDMQNWQEKLNLIAESRTSAVNQWIAENYGELRALASNPSLQLYLTELQVMPDAKAPTSLETEPPQKSYLRTLLIFTAERGGFSTPSGTSAIPANVQQEATRNGLAVIGKDGQVIVSTAMTPEAKADMLARIKGATPGKEALIDLWKDGDGTLYMGFAVPVFSIQGDETAASQIGYVVGIKQVDENLFSRLKHPGIKEESLEIMLVRKREGQVEYLSPLMDGSASLSKQTETGNPNSAESRLLKIPGDFVSNLKDYRNEKVLATSREVEGAPWMLIVKINEKKALAESTAHRTNMVTFFFMLIAIIVLIIVAVWRHAFSKRAMFMSQHFRRMAAVALAQEQLLRLVADHQPEPVYIIDTHDTYQFANQQAATEAKISLEHILGKGINDVRGTAQAEIIQAQSRKAMKQRQVIYAVEKLRDGGDSERVVRFAYVPLDHIPVASLPEPTPGVLVVEQDISEIVHERESRLLAQQQLVLTLIRLVDKRDPFAANHSLLVSQIAYEIATDMELDDATVEAARTAGSLMNIGKIVIPTELLTKTDSLSADEKLTIRDSMNMAADLVKDIPFGGPVADTLRQWQEKWDGSGPLALKGDTILLSARIIAVANAFVGMISPRSWRTAIPIEQANKFLLEQADAAFDRRVVIALINYVENHHGRTWLKQVLEGQKHVA